MWPWTAAMPHRPFLLPLTSLNHWPPHHAPHLSFPTRNSGKWHCRNDRTWLSVQNTLDINLDFINYDHSDLCAAHQTAMNLINSRLSSEFHWFARRVSSFCHFVCFFAKFCFNLVREKIRNFCEIENAKISKKIMRIFSKKCENFPKKWKLCKKPKIFAKNTEFFKTNAKF